MDEEATCGKGLAQNSVLPGKLGEWAAAVAENLAVHMRSLDASDPDSRQEYQIYDQLTEEYRETAARLMATANAMAAARDLPMAPHEFTAAINADALAAFEKVVKIKRELSALLEQASDSDRNLLSQMRSAQS